MKKAIFIVSLIILGVALGQQVGTALRAQGSPTLISPDETSSQIKVEKETTFYPPKTLEIPVIGVLSDIEQVELDEKGNMDVPKGVQNAGWYSLGYKIGEKGSVVLAGHLDDTDGKPAVFWNVSKLKAGDEILVTDETENSFRYTVTKVETYLFDEFPLEEVFLSKDKPRLNLITCEGTFDREAKNYSHRTVVFSELME